ncbi:3-deoxy-D-manno-octulosonate 8-phosphate phosphatase KdsC [Limihaloglobus sulfuriphilus]|uniref:3-deoxy-D-manno-octulosonate 8-phosphate phosphatase KdsC n=1 Tax=Limihaloglobus sulfuriphilus TaxID=1851148 RepID=A0A1R7T5W2_9BACT|nr:HAD-IIIA family hydrolase [Limihaloglobus sulfuriphilus]AQQ71876.1 3-deoxy-D-manno-octulosonate 8-phosphate phosphatase KdsC [Limihaloglobus sulfuriphilus]
MKVDAEKAKNIKMLILDVDGVLTDGGIILAEDGTEMKLFNSQDGHGIKLWQRAGLETAIISGRVTNVTAKRAEQLDIKYVMQGCKKKLPAYESLLEKVGLTAAQTAYIGDDTIDIPLVRRAGFGAAVENAVDELKHYADYTTKRKGGSGAVREVIELLLKASGRWDSLMERYLI